MNLLLTLAIIFVWLITLLIALSAGVIFGLYTMSDYIRRILARNSYTLVDDRLVRIMEGGDGRG